MKNIVSPGINSTLEIDEETMHLRHGSVDAQPQGRRQLSLCVVLNLTVREVGETSCIYRDAVGGCKDVYRFGPLDGGGNNPSHVSLRRVLAYECEITMVANL